MKTVELLVPVYNEEEGLTDFYRAVSSLAESLREYRFSFLFINDGSSDSSLNVIKYLAKDDPRVKYISFSRNFGKEAAIYAGLQYSSADFMILLDADLQHPPELIPKMLEAVKSGEWDACGAKRKPGIMSRLFAKLNNRLSTVKLQTGATDFMCMSRKFVEAVLMLSETQRFSKGLFAWVGFRVKWLDYTQGPRTKGTSKWNFWKLFSYAVDGITGFSVIPLRLITIVGCVVCFLALVYIIWTLIKTLVKGIDVPGYATLLVVMLFLGGLILLSVGILGNYISRIFMESKNRPIFILDQTNLKQGMKRNPQGQVRQITDRFPQKPQTAPQRQQSPPGQPKQAVPQKQQTAPQKQQGQQSQPGQPKQPAPQTEPQKPQTAQQKPQGQPRRKQGQPSKSKKESGKKSVNTENE